MLGGATLAWARALGEFGATLVFAGNLPGRTQTVPLAIYAALESDVRAALALSLVLAAAGIVILFALRTGPKQWIERQTNSKSSRINDGGR
jgi:molybdate transport system permease protein